jgi:pimeloyl-ACP methyl ester carboxylesterase
MRPIVSKRASARKRLPKGSRWLLLPVVAVAGAYYAAPRLMMRAFSPPQRDVSRVPSDLGLPQQQIWLHNVNGTRLHGWFIPVVGPAPVVIVLHGWGGNAALMLPLAPYLHEAGFHALFLDSRNHGRSDHERFTSMPRFAEDLEVAADWVRSQGEVTAIGVIGHSVGAGAAILSASRSDQFDAVVSVSAPAHPGEMMREQMTRIPGPLLTLLFETMQNVIGHRFDDFAPRNRIGAVEAAVLIVHGAVDRVVPVASLHELASAQPRAETIIVQNAGHSDLESFASNVDEITDFLDRNLRG